MSIYKKAVEELNDDFASDHTQFVYESGKKWEFIKIVVERNLTLEAKLVWSYQNRDSIEEVKQDALERLDQFRKEFWQILYGD